MRLLLSLLFALLAGLLLVRGWLRVDEGRRSLQWPTVTGKVMGSNVQKRLGVGGRTYYEANVEYEYEIGSESYLADRIAFRPLNSAGTREVGAVVRRYPVGSAVRVYYNPAHPEQAVLRPGVPWTSWIEPALGAMLLLLAIITLSVRVQVKRNA